MKDYELFENKLSKKFQGFNPEISDDKIWGAVEAKLPKKNEERKYIFILLFGLLMLASSIALYNTSATKSNEDRVSKEKIIIANEKVTIDNSEKEESKMTFSDDPIETSTPASVITESVEQIERVVLDQKIIDDDNLNANQKSSYVVKNNLIEAEVYSAEKAIASNASTINLILDKLDQSIKSIAPLFGLTIKPLGFHSRLLPDVGNANFLPIQFSTVVEWKPQHKLFFTSGVYMNNISFDSETVDIDLLNERKSSEHALETWELGLGFEYQLSNKLSISSGLNFWNYTEKANYNLESESVITLQDTLIGYLHLADNTTKEIIGETTVTQINRSKHLHYNTYQSLSFPILFNYKLLSKNKIDFGLGLGFEKSIWSSRNGIYHDDLSMEYDLKEDQDNRFKNSNGDFLLANLKLNYNLQNNFSLFLSAAYKHGLNNYTSSNSLVSKRNNFYGIQLGTNFKI